MYFSFSCFNTIKSYTSRQQHLAHIVAKLPKIAYDKIKMETNGGRNMAQRTDVTAMTTPIETHTIPIPFQFPFPHL